MDLYQQVDRERSRCQGWCTAEKAKVLVDLVLQERPSTVVEIGVFGGSSFVPLVMAVANVGAGKVIGIDPWTKVDALEGMAEPANKKWWSEAFDYDEVHRGCVERLQSLGLPQFWELRRMTAEKAVSDFDRCSINLLHLDGNHSEGPAIRDVKQYFPRLAAGGIIIVDDVDWKELGKPTVIPVLKFLLDAGCKRIGQVDKSVVMRTPQKAVKKVS